MHSSLSIALLCSVACLTGATAAQAESNRAPLPRVIATTTAHLPAAGQIVYSGGLDHTFLPAGFTSVGLAGIAELGLSMEREWKEPGEEQKIAMGYFKMGTPEGFLKPWVPALALTFRKSLNDKVQFFSGSQSPTIATISTVASKTIGPLSLHLGAELISAQSPSTQNRVSHQLRPTLAIEWNPQQYPKTTIVADMRWIPSEVRQAAAPNKITPIWNAAWGVKYHAFTWASVDLNVRHQEGQSSSDAVVTLGLTGSFSLLQTPRPINLKRSTQIGQ